MGLYGIEEGKLAVNLLPCMTKKLTHNPHREMKTLKYIVDVALINV